MVQATANRIENLYDDRLEVDETGSDTEDMQLQDSRYMLVNDKSPGTDGTSALPPGLRHMVKYGGGLDDGGGEKGFFTRWKEYRKILKEQYPWVKGRALKRLPEIPINYGLYRFWKHVSDNITDREGVGSNLIGGLADAFKISHWNVYKSLPFHIFPRANVMTLNSNGATEIDRMYTTMKGGYEIPVAFQRINEEQPSEETLRKAVGYVEKYRVSPFNKAESLGNLIDNAFVQRAFDKYTRGDYTRYFSNEPGKMNRWITKDETWVIYQYGTRDVEIEDSMPTDLKSKIRVYREPGRKSGFWYRMGNLLGDDTPSCGTMWWYWQMGDWLYDSVDLLFGPAEAVLTKIRVPDEGIRHVMDQEYKVVASMRRNFTAKRGSDFTYQLPGIGPMHVREAGRAAADIGYK